MEIQVVLPPRGVDDLSYGLRWLTKGLCERLGEDGTGGLGGEFGYGVNFENEVFAMRRFYWGDCDCEQRGDPGHADTCSLMLPNFHHKASGFKVRWYKWIGRDNEVEGRHSDIRAMLAECLASVAAA